MMVGISERYSSAYSQNSRIGQPPFQFVVLLLQTFIFGRLPNRTLTELPDQIFDAEDVQIAVQGVTGLIDDVIGQTPLVIVHTGT